MKYMQQECVFEAQEKAGSWQEWQYRNIRIFRILAREGMTEWNSLTGPWDNLPVQTAA